MNIQRDVTLSDKYALECGQAYMTGTQALVRLPMLQRQRDELKGLNTACFISGYRGSPLGNLDRELWKAKEFVAAQHIKFEPGINEEMGATSVWGSQQVGLFEGALYDGVYGMWYGKTPGIDRSGDVFKHANYAGTSPNGGVLALAGDDHNCKSSTIPCQSEYAFMDAQIPVLNPSNVQEFLDYGVLGWEMSRFSGCWVAMKTISETVDASASVYIDPNRIQTLYPDFDFPNDGVHIRWPDKPLEQEYRLQKYKLYAALAFARANKLDKVMIDSDKARLGIVTSGKSYQDVLQALEDLGIDQDRASTLGVRLYKVAMPWPLEPEGIKEFTKGLDEILVVEEKRAVIENQLKEQLYNWNEKDRPRVIGKFDEDGDWILPSANELSPARIARVIAARIKKYFTDDAIEERLAWLDAKEEELAKPRRTTHRMPTFCSGCPHNTSTKLPEGSRALAGIGCHYMATWVRAEQTQTFTQMGGEGVPWVGQSHFTKENHVFANLGDGTYYHSGILAIRQALGANVNITYKILFNAAVAMTGGQPVDGPLTVQGLTKQLNGEGVKRIAIVSNEPNKYPSRMEFAPDVSFHHRDDMDEVQRDLRNWPGVSVLIYDQHCATELRRMRKRGKAPVPARRLFINDAVCEGCGDCGVASNCVSITPKETVLGRKRKIDQSTCNMDYSCVNGFCPSFVSVHGANLRKKEGHTQADDFATTHLPAPILPATNETYSIVVTGIGGTGVVTIGALLGMAAHMENKGVSVLDMTGLAQKNGSVISHIRLADSPEDIYSVKIPAGEADLMLGCDLVTSASFDALAKLKSGKSKAIINDHKVMTPDFACNRDAPFPLNGMKQSIAEAVDKAHSWFFDASQLASKLLGDSIGSNMFVVGYAFQLGLIPISEGSLLKAIELNGVRVDFNQRAFVLGRWAAHDMDKLSELIEDEKPQFIQQDLEALIKHRISHLTDYQDADYAERYSHMVSRVYRAEQELGTGSQELTKSVAHVLAKLMAYKDEYEVARLYSSPEFKKKLSEQFEGKFKISFHLSPPLLADRDQRTGLPLKKEYGPWVLSVFKFLAKFKGLRGGKYDIFAKTAERKMERALISEYMGTLEEICQNLKDYNLDIATQIADLPREIRGFGHIKEQAVHKVKAQEKKLLKEFKAARPSDLAAQ
ncbi:Indolepyruvate ferredoxin oxidoreductase [Candidatus Terasakiella magnetica]|uniref:Indolepyruvate ferredoxin oxidoreductase n=1 Tax=Candidatus Terasakiella magnetica TaxID=1867952 RepID=A0A1C3RDQ4_9PROT|nr:indolepyruvate ferredoxin oxidoreductase family protein [Candidatus Terasakiella magnetica]SCA55344.1 Indolepyruvate ferredoxin oxidoreductase [Candidatus Terasakiella magnetica]